jgi:hypothetical protein
MLRDREKDLILLRGKRKVRKVNMFFRIGYKHTSLLRLPILKRFSVASLKKRREKKIQIFCSDGVAVLRSDQQGPCGEFTGFFTLWLSLILTSNFIAESWNHSINGCLQCHDGCRSR